MYKEDHGKAQEGLGDIPTAGKEEELSCEADGVVPAHLPTPAE